MVRGWCGSARRGLVQESTHCRVSSLSGPSDSIRLSRPAICEYCFARRLLAVRQWRRPCSGTLRRPIFYACRPDTVDAQAGLPTYRPPAPPRPSQSNPTPVQPRPGRVHNTAELTARQSEHTAQHSTAQGSAAQRNPARPSVEEGGSGAHWLQ